MLFAQLQRLPKEGDTVWYVSDYREGKTTHRSYLAIVREGVVSGIVLEDKKIWIPTGGRAIETSYSWWRVYDSRPEPCYDGGQYIGMFPEKIINVLKEEFGLTAKLAVNGTVRIGVFDESGTYIQKDRADDEEFLWGIYRSLLLRLMNLSWDIQSPKKPGLAVAFPSAAQAELYPLRGKVLRF